MKILGLGLSRTGTTSLDAALGLLGFRTRHWFFDMGEFDDRDGEPGLEAGTDIPLLPHWRALDAKFVGSRFVLTTRPLHDWLASMRAFLPRSRRGAPIDVRKRAYLELLAYVYGTVVYDETLLTEAYLAHHAEIRTAFAGRPGDLLELDVTTHPDPWSPLCRFLDRERPATPFPHVNSTRERAARRGAMAG